MDRSLGKGVVAALTPFHAEVFAHDDLFPQDTDDDVWLEEVGRRGMVALTKEGMTGPDQAAAFATALPEILRIARDEPDGGYIKGVNRNGEVRHLFPRA